MIFPCDGYAYQLKGKNTSAHNIPTPSVWTWPHANQLFKAWDTRWMSYHALRTLQLPGVSGNPTVNDPVSPIPPLTASPASDTNHKPGPPAPLTYRLYVRGSHGPLLEFKNLLVCLQECRKALFLTIICLL